MELGDLLRAGVLAHVGVSQRLEEELVGEHVDGELLVTEGVDAGGSAAGGGSDLEGDGPQRFPHAYEERYQLLV